VVRAAEAWSREELTLRLRGIENCLTAEVLATGARHAGGGQLDSNSVAMLRALADMRELQRQLAGAALNRPLALERQFWRLNGAAAGQSR